MSCIRRQDRRTKKNRNKGNKQKTGNNMEYLSPNRKQVITWNI